MRAEPSNATLMALNASERNERLLTWAREHGEEFRGKEAADALGIKAQGIGPMLAAFVRKGDLKVGYHGSTRMYVAAEAEEDAGEMTNDEIAGITSLNISDKLKEDFEERQSEIEDVEIPEAEQVLENATQALANLRAELETVNRTLKAFG